MDLEQIFSFCSGLAMLGWLGLALAPRLEFTRDTMPSLIIPIILGVTYAYLMFSFSGSASEDGGFGSLAEVKALFGVDALLLAGWIHYLAFDLFVGAWIVRDAQKEWISHWLVLPCLFFTLMAGPFGLLLYLVLRAANNARQG
ncbi:MAG: hypothetical protein CNF01_07940 [Halieaceae bacterium MED-G27]|nr:MAG: hypothetical protein CNF01_07940 [Halieaceae bacterium MED-G27]|tara:strand:- start:97 stop:525 length:429 start_codon:yes stop_codon:yes gene_type:complete